MKNNVMLEAKEVFDFTRIVRCSILNGLKVWGKNEMLICILKWETGVEGGILDDKFG